MQQGKAEFIIPLLLERPEDFERDTALAEVPEHNTMFTVDGRKIPLSSVTADGTGAYCKWGNVQKFYFFNGDQCQVAHKIEEKGTYYVNVRRKSSTWKKQNVDSNDIFKIIRHYRYNKNNDLSHLIVEVEHDGIFLNHYYVLYRWLKTNENSEFVSSRHENATNPLQGIEFCS